MNRATEITTKRPRRIAPLGPHIYTLLVQLCKQDQGEGVHLVALKRPTNAHKYVHIYTNTKYTITHANDLRWQKGLIMKVLSVRERSSAFVVCVCVLSVYFNDDLSKTAEVLRRLQSKCIC